MFNADTYKCDNTNVKEELTEFHELIAPTKTQRIIDMIGQGKL